MVVKPCILKRSVRSALPAGQGFQVVGHKGRNALLAFDRRGAAGLHHQGTLLAAARVFTPGGHHQAGAPQSFCGHANMSEVRT